MKGHPPTTAGAKRGVQGEAMKSSLRWIGILMMTVAGVWAQSSAARTFPVRGEIVSSAASFGSVTVELAGQGGGVMERVPVNADGSFEFRQAAAGTYELRVVGFGGEVLHQETVYLNGSNQSLSIRLPERTGSASRATGSSVSIGELSHKIPAQAQKLFDKGEQSFAKHNVAEARDLYRQALELDPEFVDAYNELGAAEAAMGRLPEAAEQFQKAIDIAPENQLALPNLCIVLAKMRRFHEAGEVARRALRVVPGSGPIHYILAASIIEEHGNADEAIEHMKRAAAEIPSAHLVASDLLADRGRRQEAVRQLEEYLLVTSPTDTMRPKVEARLAELRQ
jgi:tetratricopeptide (TPR) repeat protein